MVMGGGGEGAEANVRAEGLSVRPPVPHLFSIGQRHENRGAPYSARPILVTSFFSGLPGLAGCLLLMNAPWAAVGWDRSSEAVKGIRVRGAVKKAVKCSIKSEKGATCPPHRTTEESPHLHAFLNAHLTA